MKMEEEKEREVRFQVPWNLQALFLPGLQQQGPICQSMQEYQLQHIPWSDRDRGMFAGTLPTLENIPFGELLALANVASVSSTGLAPPGYGMDSAALVNSPSDSCRMDSSSGILNPGFSLGLQTWFDGERARENPECSKTDELSASRQYFYDLNLPPKEMMNMNPQTTATEFAPITPEKPTRILPETQDSCSAEKTDQQHQEAIKGSLLVTGSAARKKNQKTQKREGKDVEQIKTPQQKPRRKKHRPKVVIEGKPKRPSKLEISKPAEPRGEKSGKRRNVKRKEDGVELMPLSVEAAAETSDLRSCCRPKRSTRRVLNLYYDTEEEEEESFTMPPSDFPELHLQEKLCMNAANEFSIHRVNQVRKNHTSGRQEAPSVPMLIFSNIPKRRRSTPAGRFNNDRRTNQASEDNDHKYMPLSTLPIGYEHSHLSEGRLTESAKGKNPTVTDQADTGRDFLRIQCSRLHIFPTTFWVQFPNICRKRRTDGSSFATPSTSASVAAEKDIVQREIISQYNPDMAPSEGLRVTPQWLTDLTHLKKFRRKRSRTITRARNFDSLKRILEACDSRGYRASHKPQSLEVIVSQMQLTVSRKKRTHSNSILSRFNARRLQMQWGFYLQHHVSSSAKSTGKSLDKLRKQLIPIDEISEWLEQLDINRESPCVPYHKQNALIPYRTRYREQNALIPHGIRHQEQNALVLYKRDGTIIPLESSLYPYKKQRPRPMVKLDDETTRVWKLLMADINNQGVDGTDEEKEKWWEEERKVFQGRADSFIARMRLVQGDRRFSPWKGSIVDSVIGVFLTQNVSDHLSSSAFMAMAAQFPLKSNSNKRPCHEEWGSSLTHEPLICLEDSGDVVSAPPACKRRCIIHDEDNNAVCTNETSRTCGGLISYPKNGFETYSDLEAKKIAYHVEDRREILHPSQHSLLSQDFKNFEPAINVDIAGPCSVSKLETEDSSDASRFNSLGAPFTEFLGLSKGTIQQRHVTSIMLLDAISVNNHSKFGMIEGDRQIPCIDDDIDSKSSQGMSTTSWSSPRSQFIINQETSEVENFEQFGKKTNAVSQPRSSYQQEESINNHAQDQEENRSMEQCTETEILDMMESTNSLQNQPNTRNKTSESDRKEQINASRGINRKKASTSKLKGGIARKKKKKGNSDWDRLRRQAETDGQKRERTVGTMDSLDWEAVRHADVDKIAKTIRARGMNNMLSERIKDFLNRLVEEHGSIDLEWLRDVPPDKAKEYLLSIRGLGLKSVECVRLLTLHHLAFPVDTNVGRIAVRLGWVPLQPLPESLQLHLLEMYPVLDSIQKYLWPRLCKLDQKTLYELHYQMITFGKVFCTKSKPNCNACPMKGECRHFASAFARARLALPGTQEKSIVRTEERTKPEPVVVNFRQSLFLTQDIDQSKRSQALEASNSEAKSEAKKCEPIIEEPATPEPECTQVPENDIEDVICEDADEIPTIKLNMEAFNQNLQNYMQRNTELQEVDVSRALVALSTEAASIPTRKLKNMSRLRTEHQVYELPDSHPLLERLDKREPDDPCSYLLAIWTPGEIANSVQPPEKSCVSRGDSTLCQEKTCFSCNSVREAESQIVRGTILVPCRTAMRGSFPLNGTYFQVNEVFADHDSSLNPIDVPRGWIWNLPRRTVYFGTSIPTIFRGLTTEDIQHCFWRGYVCVRGFDHKTRAPRPLVARLHFPASKLGKRNGRTNQDET